jgi:hypothetical protein
MPLRRTLNDHPIATTTGATIIIIGCAGGVGWWWLAGPAPDSDQAYYYDMQTHKVFVAEAINHHARVPEEFAAEATNPQARAPTQQASADAAQRVHAIIYDCGTCGDYAGMTAEQIAQAGAKLAYLMRYTEPPGSVPPEVEQVPREVTRPGEENWVAIETGEGWQVMDNRPACEGDAQLRRCEPPPGQPQPQG